MPELVALAILIVVSFGIAIFVDRIGIPRISTYVAIGVLFSPDVLGHIIQFPEIQASSQLTTIALSTIAFLIGVEIDWKRVRSLGSAILLGTAGGSLGAVIAVAAGLLLLRTAGWVEVPLAVIVILAGISASTDPGAVLGVIDQYKAKGLTTRLLLGMVILDDAFGVILFEIMRNLGDASQLHSKLLGVTEHLVLAIGLGTIIGAALGALTRRMSQEELRFPLLMGSILLCASVAIWIDASYLLACISLGLITQVVSDQDPESVVSPIKHVEEFIFIVFFVLAGLHFDINVFATGLPLLVGYVIFRSLGKFVGTFTGTRMAKVPSKTARWSSLGMMPQAGVAIGLALSLASDDQLKQYAPMVFNVVLGSTLIFEIIGPILSKRGLRLAGEITTV